MQFSNYITEIGITRNIGHSFWQKAASSLLETGKIRFPIPGKSKISKVSKEELLSDPKLEGVITWSLNLNTFTNQESETLLKRIDYILEVLASEIEN